MDSTDARDRYLEVRGLRLCARERGAEDGPGAVLLHGWLDHRGSFDRLAPLLGGMRTIAIDHRGHGDSSWVGAGGFYHFIEYVGDLDGVLDALSLGVAGADGPCGPVRLVGHSLGGAVALVFAAVRPERVAHVVLLDGVPLATRSTEFVRRIADYLDDLKKPRDRRAVVSVEDAAERMRRAQDALPADVALELALQGTSRSAGGPLSWKWDPLVRAHSPLPFSEAVLQALLPAVRAPVLLLRAENGILPPEDTLRVRLGALPRLRIATVAGVGHHLHLEKPEQIAAHIREAWRGE